MADKGLEKLNEKAPYPNSDKTPMRTGNPQMNPKGDTAADKPPPDRPHAPPTGPDQGQD